MNREQRRATQGKKPTEAEMNSLREAESDSCSNCGNHFAQALPYFVVQRDNGLKALCGTCMLVETTPPVYVGLYMGGGDPWAADDREWFKNHHRRSYRLREPWPGEIQTMAVVFPEQREYNFAFIQKVADQGKRLAVVVYQIEPGKRVRSLAGVPGDDPFDSYTDAGINRLIPGTDKLGEDIANAGGADKMMKEQNQRRMDVTADILRTIGVARSDEMEP